MQFIILAAIAALLTNISVANAADVVKRHVSPVAVVIATPPVFNWAGPYLGIETGAAFSHFYSTAQTNRPTNAEVKDLLGRPNDKPLLGLFAGYNFRLGQHAILGIDGNIDFHESEALMPPASDDETIPTIYNVYQEKALAGARIRLGYAHGRVMPYIAGGLSVLRAGAASGFVAEGVEKSNKILHNHTGWNIGAGVDYAMAHNIFLRADYRFSETKIKNHYIIEAGNLYKETNDTGVKSHQLRIGAAYKF